MPGPVISVQELANAEKLRGRGDFSTALRLTQEMLSRAEDDGTRMRLLFDLLDCSTQLRLDEITRHAIAELERLPEPKISQLIAGFIKAISLIEHGGRSWSPQAPRRASAVRPTAGLGVPGERSLLAGVKVVADNFPHSAHNEP